MPVEERNYLYFQLRHDRGGSMDTTPPSQRTDLVPFQNKPASVNIQDSNIYIVKNYDPRIITAALLETPSSLLYSISNLKFLQLSS